MIFAFLTFSRALERNMTFEGVQIKYGIDTDGFAYFGSASKAQNAINFTYSGAVLLPEGLKYRNRTIKFKMIKEFAFANTKITSISLPATLKWIGRSSFENCVGLTVINASDTNLTMIDRRAFKGCRNLRNIFLPSSVFAFGRSTFEGTLISHIPNLNYTLIEDFSFANNHEIMAVDLSKSSLTVIGESLFENCTKLMTIVLPDSIYYIKSKAFARTSIKSFDLPKNISVIHKYVFCGCKSITSADLSNHPTNCISEGLYCNCTCLEHIVLPKKCYWIGPYSFYNTKIKSISLPKECHSVGEYSFGECRELASADFGQTMIENLTNGLFFNCSKLITFKYPKVIRSIGSYALYNTKFTDIGPLKYLESLDSNSFTNSKIQNVNMINATILTLPSKLFYNNKNIISINISNKTKYIGSYAFSGTLLTTIYIPPNITEFGEGALSFCPKLTHMLLNVTRLLELPKNMFENCFNLSFVRVPRYLNTLGDGCFKNCINLECVYGSRRLKIIGQRSFYNCTSIREVDFSKTEISYIDESAFAFCSNLTRFVMSTYTLGTGPLAFANTGLKSFEFFHNIGTKCLFNCTDLEFVNMSSSTITILNSELFGNCKNLKSVHLPKLVIFIGKSVFRNCPNLHTVYYNGTQPLDLSKLPKNCKVLPPPILNMTNTTSNSLVNVTFQKANFPNEIWQKYFGFPVKRYTHIETNEKPAISQNYFLYASNFINFTDNIINCSINSIKLLHSIRTYTNISQNKGDGGCIYFNCNSSIVQDRFCSIKCYTPNNGKYSFTSVQEKTNKNFVNLGSLYQCGHDKTGKSAIYHCNGEQCLKSTNNSFSVCHDNAGYYFESSPVIVNFCCFISNDITEASCVCMMHKNTPDSFVKRSIFKNNTCVNHNLYRGLISSVELSVVTVSECIFLKNVAENTFGAYQGGIITIINCTGDDLSVSSSNATVYSDKISSSSFNFTLHLLSLGKCEADYPVSVDLVLFPSLNMKGRKNEENCAFNLSLECIMNLENS